MDCQCTDQELVSIAKLIVKWEVIAPFLGISEPEQAEIRRDWPGDYAMQKQDMLRKWKTKRGREATPRELIRVLTETNHVHIAEQIEDMILQLPGKQPQGLVLGKANSIGLACGYLCINVLLQQRCACLHR